MKKTFISKIISLAILTALLCSVIIGYTTPASARVSVSEAEAEVNYIKNKKAQLSETLSDLESGRDDIVKYISKTDRKLSKISDDIREVKEKISELDKSIKILKEEITSAEIDINHQYDVMKKRIKYMYERGNSDYINILIESKSISDYLNRSEYIEQITEYDKNMLNNFIQSKKDLENKKSELERNRQKLKTEKTALRLEKNALRKVARKKNEELKKYTLEIAEADQKMIRYTNELEKQEEILLNALIEKQKEIERQEAEKKAAKEAALAENNKTVLSEKTEKSSKETAVPAKEKTTSSSASGFIWPLSVAGTITSHFGYRVSPTKGASSYHQGIDIGVSEGTPIRASKSGNVVTASYSAAAGNYVMISHGDGVYTVYMHASSLNVEVGQSVSQGQTIAYVGSTGISTGNHLHFGISVNNAYVDPEKYVSR